MPDLHIVQAGVKNGDKKWLERAAQKGSVSTPTWVTPRSAAIGDEVVFYVGGFGFFATGGILSSPRPRADWPRRHGTAIGSILLIEPPISLASIQRRLPTLKWANYPRSIHTPDPSVAHRIREFIRSRRTKGIPVSDLAEKTLKPASLAELRAVALMSMGKSVAPQARQAIIRARSWAIRFYVLKRANRHCEGCRSGAPFVTPDGSPFHEAHHIDRLADDGPDHPRKAVALCPNCHRKVHYGRDGKAFNQKLQERVAAIEALPVR